jgi:hypothetical protein
LFLTYFSGSTPISCGTRLVSTNAYILGKDLLEVEKCAVFWWQGNFMNRLINRSWGEGFVKISLDLSRHIFRFSSSTIVCALGRTIERHLSQDAEKVRQRRKTVIWFVWFFG